MKNTYKILLGFAVGAAAGAALGVLFAPDKGVETRAKINAKGKKVVDDAMELIDKNKEKFSHLKNGILHHKREPVEEMS